jgi:DNA-binding CsgD family transcriptional regulator
MAHYIDDGTETLVDAIYDASLDASKWNAFVDQLTRSIAGTRCLFVLHDPSTQTGQITTPCLDPAHVASYNRHYGAINPWLKNVKGIPVGLVVPSELRFPSELLPRTEFYADWLRPQGLHSGAGVTILQDAGRFMALSTLFPAGMEEQKRSAVARMQRLVPHLRRAAEINRQLGFSDFRWRAAEQALNRLLVSVIIVGSDLSIIFSNRSAEALLAKEDGIGAGRSGRLAIADPESAEQLARMVQSPHAHHGGGRIMAVSRPSGRRAFAVLVAPLARQPQGAEARSDEFARAGAILFIRDAAETIDVSGEVLSALFDLSPAEARLVKALLEGHRLEEAARRLGISHNTAKTQLKAAFAKMGCTRQSDLIQMVSSSVANFID